MGRKSKVQIQLENDLAEFHIIKTRLRELGCAIAIFTPAELAEVKMSQKIAEQFMVEIVNG